MPRDPGLFHLSALSSLMGTLLFSGLLFHGHKTVTAPPDITSNVPVRKMDKEHSRSHIVTIEKHSGPHIVTVEKPPCSLVFHLHSIGQNRTTCFTPWQIIKRKFLEGCREVWVDWSVVSATLPRVSWLDPEHAHLQHSETLPESSPKGLIHFIVLPTQWKGIAFSCQNQTIIKKLLFVHC